LPSRFGLRTGVSRGAVTGGAGCGATALSVPSGGIPRASRVTSASASGPSVLSTAEKVPEIQPLQREFKPYVPSQTKRRQNKAHSSRRSVEVGGVDRRRRVAYRRRALGG